MTTGRQLLYFKQTKRFLIFISLIVFISSCANRLEKNTQDNSAWFYKEGLRFLQEHELVQAELSFNHALDFNKNFAPAYEGLARVYFERGHYSKAENLAKKSHQLNKNWLPARIIKARIYLAEGDYDLSRDELLLALKDAGSMKLPVIKSTLHQLLAKNYLLQRNFTRAGEHLKTSLQYNADNDKAQQTLREIEDDLAVLLGRQDEILDIAAKPMISRADLAVIIFFEFQGLEMFNDKGPERSSNPIASDVRPDYKSFKAVQFCLQNKLLPLLPDSTFRPNDKVDRAEMAIFLQNMLTVFDPGSDYQSSSMSSKKIFFKDASEMELYYSAVHKAVSFGLMSADAAGFFMPRRLVNGLEAVKTISRLQNLF